VPVKKTAGKKTESLRASPERKPRGGKKGVKPQAPGNPSRGSAAKDATVDETRENNGRFPIVGIGASAGGLEAFEAFFKAMPPDSGMAFVLVAHLDPDHASLLPELVQKRTAMSVYQAQDGINVQQNSVYVIPPNKELGILNGVLQLMDLSRPRGSNLPIDVFLRSLALDQGADAVCVILSGTGTDGTLGLKAVKGEAGMTMVQDEESAKYDGMPRSAIATGLVDYVMPPEQMPAQLIKYIKHASLAATPLVIPATGQVPDALQKIFIVLRSRTDHDFSLYKKNTICRRIERRMNVHQIDNISDYVRYLQESKREAGVLFKELLIGVTSFFRDPDAYEALTKKALIKLLSNKPQEGTVRVWVPGCSSGEEAYSIGIILHECMLELKRHLSVQIFGTDIDEDAINAARAGLYPASIVADVTPERLARYFAKEDDGQYRIKKSIREMLVFATQNIIKDPPFTKLDLLSCRNLLIYLGPELQRKLMPLFHYSLRSDGVLFLGTSETIGQSTDLFALTDKKWKVFGRKPSKSAHHTMLDFPAEAPVSEGSEIDIPATVKNAEEISALQLVETILQQIATPPCAIVDDVFDVIYIHGRTGMFLEPAEGRVSVNIVEMARPGLKMELASALRKVSRDKREVVCRGLKVPQNGNLVVVDLTVKPILEQLPLRGLMMVMFEQVEGPRSSVTGKGGKRKKTSAAEPGKKNAEELAQELLYTRESLQTTIEELETSNEELKSTNEELQSTNEELQSTNEELETSKEELQSLNEESITVNAELQSRIDELSNASDDMKNLFDSTDIATIFLDTELRVRRFTPKATEIIPLAGTDVDRPVTHFASNLVETDLAGYAQEVLDDLAVREIKVSDVTGRRYTLRIRPYRTAQNVIDGIVITFEDITELERRVDEESAINVELQTQMDERRQVEEELQKERSFSTEIIQTVEALVVVLDTKGRVVRFNLSCERVTGYSAEEVIGKPFWDLFLIPEETASVKSVFAKLREGDFPTRHENHWVTKSGERRRIRWSNSAIVDDGGKVEHIIGIGMDMTEDPVGH